MQSGQTAPNLVTGFKNQITAPTITNVPQQMINNVANASGQSQMVMPNIDSMTVLGVTLKKKYFYIILIIILCVVAYFIYKWMYKKKSPDEEEFEDDDPRNYPIVFGPTPKKLTPQQVQHIQRMQQMQMQQMAMPAATEQNEAELPEINNEQPEQ